MEIILHDLTKMYSVSKCRYDPLFKLGRENTMTAKFSYIEKEHGISKENVGTQRIGKDLDNQLSCGIALNNK